MKLEDFNDMPPCRLWSRFMADYRFETEEWGLHEA